MKVFFRRTESDLLNSYYSSKTNNNINNLFLQADSRLYVQEFPKDLIYSMQHSFHFDGRKFLGFCVNKVVKRGRPE
jgi:hypothetical protein